MAPQAKLFLVESDCNWSIPTHSGHAVTLAAKLVAESGGGVVSMSWGDPEVKKEKNWDKYFTEPGVVFFAASGDSGIGVSIYPGASPNVVSVGGTYFNRDQQRRFCERGLYTAAAAATSVPTRSSEPIRAASQSIVGTHRGYPDVASDFCCAAIYLQGGWYAVGGTSWASPTFAGIVNAAGNKQQSTVDELTRMYSELANPTEYAADFNDITQGDSQCTVGFDQCTGIGSPKTYTGK